MPESRKRKPKRSTYTPPPTKAARNRPPSPPWYGALIVVLFLVAVVWIIGYTIGPIPGQTSLGGWNYLVAIGLAIGAVGMLTSWR